MQNGSYTAESDSAVECKGRVHEAHRNLLDHRSYLGYSSILEALVDVLTNDGALRKRLAERVKYVIVDEYQDVNPVQETIVWSLHDLGARICVLGDDDQTIYQWRGSDVKNILEFAQRYYLWTKFRSTIISVRVKGSSRQRARSSRRIATVFQRR